MREPMAGPPLPFAEWARLLVDETRRRVPTVEVASRGPRILVLRENGRAAYVIEEEPLRWVHFAGEGVRMASVHDRELGDAETARALAQTVAGFFAAAHVHRAEQQGERMVE